MSFSTSARALVTIAALTSALSASAATTTTTTTLANRLPIANAGLDRTGVTNVAVSFNASASSDPDGTIITYWWNWGDGTSTAVASATASHVYTTPGTFSAVLWVQDNKSGWSLASDTAIATIGGSAQTSTTTIATTTTTTHLGTTTTTTTLANRPPIAKAGPDQSTQTFIGLTFNGSGSSDPDGTISLYSWTFGDGGTAGTMSATHSYGTAGTYTVTLVVRDNKGATASDTAIVTVANRPPTANAGPDKVGSPGVSVAFDGSSSLDPDGTISAYSWAFGDGATASGKTASHTYATVGNYTATLTVTDNKGASGSDTAAVSVGAAVAAGTWAARAGGSASDAGYVTASDAAGGIVVAGQFRGSMTIGTTTLTSAGYADGFLAKYTSSGAVAWARRVGGAGDDSIEGVALDPVSGDVVAAGHFAGTASFGGTSFVASGASDMVVARYSGATGAHVWSKAFGGVYDDGADAVAVDSSGNVYLTGYFRGSVNFGGATLSVPYGSDLDVFLAKFTSAGAHVWSKNFANTGNDRAYGIATDPQGNVALAGWFSNDINFGGTQLSSANGLADAFVAKFTSAGGHMWSRRMGSTTGQEQAFGVAMDASGNVAVCGYAIAAVDFGGGLLASLGSADGFVAEYAASSGAHRWSRRVGGGADDYANAVAIDASGNVIVSGSFQLTGGFGGATILAAGATDAFVAKYTSGGSPLWARGLGGISGDVATGAAVSAGSPVAAGYFNGTGVFGASSLTSAGVADSFVVRLAP